MQGTSSQWSVWEGESESISQKEELNLTEKMHPWQQLTGGYTESYISVMFTYFKKQIDRFLLYMRKWLPTIMLW